MREQEAVGRLLLADPTNLPGVVKQQTLATSLVSTLAAIKQEAEYHLQK